LFSFLVLGAQIGNVLTLSLGGIMCSSSIAGGWPLIFYSTGIMGLVWGIFWIFFYTDSPDKQKCISNGEKEYIRDKTQQTLSNHSKNEFEAPWKAILTSPACWALFVIHTCNNWGTYTFLTSIPKYMAEVLRFDIKSVSQ
jgi:ACS family sodium-dependent inorganic phosphate cotransporter-like MFS transporter 5